MKDCLRHENDKKLEHIITKDVRTTFRLEKGNRAELN